MCELSIIIPVYNIENQIARCLESILPQIGNNEIILVDDGSTDNSSSICDEYASHYDCITVTHNKNGGMSSSRNTGTKLAKGKYIWYIDGDDYIEPNSIMIVLNKIASNHDIYIINHNNIIEGKSSPHQVHFKGEIMTGIDCLLMNGAMQAWITITKTDFIRKKNLYFQEGMYHEDFEWCIRAYTLAKEVEHINKSLYNYICDRNGSIMNTVSPKSPIGYAYSSCTIKRFISSNDFSEKDIRRISRIVAVGITFSIERTKGLSKDDWILVKNFYKENIDDICYFLSKSAISHRILSLMLKLNVGIGIKLYYFMKFQL